MLFLIIYDLKDPPSARNDFDPDTQYINKWCLVATRDIYHDEEILVLTRSETYDPTCRTRGFEYLTFQHKLPWQGGHKVWAHDDPIIDAGTGEHSGQRKDYRRIAHFTKSLWKGLRFF